MNLKPVVAVSIGKNHYARMMSTQAWDALSEFAEVRHHPGAEPAGKNDLLALLPDADAVLTSWGVACLDADVLAAAPRLRAMSHLGGSIKRFVSPEVWKRNIHVTSAGLALARHVAETTLGLMIVGQKRIWPLGRHVAEGGWREPPVWDRWISRELYRKKTGIIGASNVGRFVIEFLKPFEPDILLYDPFVTPEEAARLGVTLTDLDDLLVQAEIVSLHAPANDQTFHMLNRDRLQRMRSDALLINTARGSLIDEPALIEELGKGRFFAFLDVTDPEPPAADSPLRRLPNVVVTPHIAGCIENCSRMGELGVEELRRFFAGEPPIYRITVDMLERIG